MSYQTASEALKRLLVLIEGCKEAVEIFDTMGSSQSAIEGTRRELADLTAKHRQATQDYKAAMAGLDSAKASAATLLADAKQQAADLITKAKFDAKRLADENANRIALDLQAAKAEKAAALAESQRKLAEINEAIDLAKEELACARKECCDGLAAHQKAVDEARASLEAMQAQARKLLGA